MYSYILIVLKIRIKYLIKINCCSHSTPYSVTLPSTAPPPPPPPLYDPLSTNKSTGKPALIVERIWDRLYFIHWKLKRSASAPTYQFNPAGLSLIQPLLEPYEHKVSQNSSIKGYSSPRWGPFQPLGPNQPQVIGLYWPWFKGAKLHSKIGHWNGPIFRAFWFTVFHTKIRRPRNILLFMMSLLLYFVLLICASRMFNLANGWNIYLRWIATPVKSLHHVFLPSDFWATIKLQP